MNKTMIVQWLKGWNILRLLRLLVGMMVLVQAVLMKDMLLSVAAALFTLLPLFNVGCCAGGNCRTSHTTCTTHATHPDEKLLDSK